MVDKVIDRFGAVIKGGNRRKDYGSYFCSLHHITKVAEVERRFANHQNQLAPFLEVYVRSPGQKVTAGGVCNFCQRMHAAGSHDHSIGLERSAGDACCHIPPVVNMMGEFHHILDPPIGLKRNGPLRSVGKDQMKLCLSRCAQNL